MELAEEKTRKLKFNRFQKDESEAFDFLGFTLKRAVSWQGRDIVQVRTSRKKLRKIAKSFKDWCKKVRNKRIGWIISMVNAKMRGWRNYFGIGGNSNSLREIWYIIRRTLYQWLNRRSERRSYNWKTYAQMLRFYKVGVFRSIRKDGIQLSLLDQF